MLVRSLVLLLFFAVASCASIPDTQLEATPWRLPDDRPREVVQMLHGRYDGQDFVLQARLSLTAERMQMTALDAIGRRTIDILWNEKGVQASRADWVPEALKAVDILEVIIATYWPADDPMQGRVADRAQSLNITYQTTRENAWNEQVQVQDTCWDYEMTIISYELTL